MEQVEKLKLRRLQRLVEDETNEARAKFPVDRSVESLPIVYGQNATLEELGKLSRCFNKLVIAQDPQIIKQWTNEADYRIITCISLLERMYIRRFYD